MDELIWVQGPAWPGVSLRFSTRRGGTSAAPFNSLNLGAHVGDDPAAVAENRRRLSASLPAPPAWLQQVHGTRVIDADQEPTAGMAPVQADGAFTAQAGRVVSVMVADCLPIALGDAGGTIVAVVHAGWRGLAAGVIEQALGQLREHRRQEQNWRAWIGPAIGPTAFEVGSDVVHAFARSDDGTKRYFMPRPGVADKWLADLPALAEHRLRAAGVGDVTQSGRCTYSEPELFFSYRRDGACGRMALVAWLDTPAH